MLFVPKHYQTNNWNDGFANPTPTFDEGCVEDRPVGACMRLEHKRHTTLELSFRLAESSHLGVSHQPFEPHPLNRLPTDAFSLIVCGSLPTAAGSTISQLYTLSSILAIHTNHHDWTGLEFNSPILNLGLRKRHVFFRSYPGTQSYRLWSNSE